MLPLMLLREIMSFLDVSSILMMDSAASSQREVLHKVMQGLSVPFQNVSHNYRSLLWMKSRRINIKQIQLDKKLDVDNIIKHDVTLGGGIEKFNFSGCKHLSSDVVNTLMSGVKDVKELVLSGCNRINDDAFSSMNRIRQTKLELIDLSSCILVGDDGFLSLIKHSSRLKVVKVAGCINLTDSSFCYLANCHQLIHLEVNSCNVSYSCSSLITDEAVKCISKNCLLLQSINLFNCENISDQGVESMTQLKQLVSLDLSYCSDITDNSIIPILKSLPQLQHVKLTGLFRLTEASLVDVCSKRLETLCLLNCRNIQKNSVYIDALRKACCIVTHITIDISTLNINA
jgi:hypothetical protein